MKLYYAPASPFARKVHAAIIELGLQGSVELIFTPVVPGKPDEEYVRLHNPLGKIPTLQLDTGDVIVDSTIICEYLDSISPAAKLLPSDNNSRFLTLSRQALAHGICESAVTLRYETFLRPESRQWDVWIADHWGKIERALTWFDNNQDAWRGDLDLAQISLGCALGYLDFRTPEYEWRDQHPALGEWFEQVSLRECFVKTQPK